MVLGLRRVAGAGFAGVWAFAAAGLLVVRTGLGARMEGFPRGFWGDVLDEDVVVVPDEVVVVVEVVKSEAEERAVGDDGGSLVAGAGVGCRVLWLMRTRLRVRASGLCARFPWCPACFPVAVHVYPPGRWHCIRCAGWWVIRGGSTSAPGRVGACAGGSRGC